MKSKNLLTLILIFSFYLMNTNFSQILNSSFEEWDGGFPVGWFGANIPNVAVSVTQSNDAYNGSSSAKMEIVNFNGIPFPSWIQTFNEDQTLLGHSISENYGSFSFQVKGEFKSTAIAYVTSSILTEDGNSIAVGVETINNLSLNWSEVNVPMEYYSEGVASHMYIQFALLDSSDTEQNIETVGSFVLIDNIVMGAVTDIGDKITSPVEFSLDQNYPNPFNPTTTINYSIAANGNESQESVKLVVFDVLGREVKTLYSGNQPAGNYQVTFDAGNIPSGVYYYQLSAGSFVQTKKMMLVK